MKTGATRWLHLHALAVLAIAQPLFDQFGRNPTFFVAHRASTTTIWLITLGLFLVPAALVAAFSLGVAAVHKRTGWWLHCALIGFLGALVLMPAWNRVFGQSAALSIAAAVLTTAGIATLYLRSERLRPFFGYLGAFTLVILGLFVGNSGVTDLLFAKDVSVSSSGGNDTSVVMIVLDEFPIAGLLDADHNLDPTRAPNLVAFASESATWYANTTTVSARTQWSVPAMLTGNMADLDATPIAAQYPQNLFTETAGSHDMLVAESITRLCPEAACAERAILDTADDDSGSILNDTRVLYFHTLLPTTLAERWLPPINTGWTGFGATGDDAATDADDDADDDNVGDDDVEAAEAQDPDTTVAVDADPTSFEWLDGDLRQDQRLRFERLIGELANNDGPTVSYGHFLLPHAPWRYLPDGTLYNGDAIPGLRSGSEVWDGSQAIVDQSTHRFLLQTGFTDLLLGRVFDELKASDQFDDSLIIITSDHGTSFAQGSSRREIQEGTEADIAMVPLFIKYPGQSEGRVVTEPVQTTDIFPTIADVLQFDLPEPVDGVSLLATDRPALPRAFAAGTPIDDLDPRLNLDQAIERITSVVPSGVPADQVWGSLAVRDIVGQEASELPQTNDVSPFQIAPPNGSTYRQINRGSGFVPIRYQASVVDGSADDGTTIVVALNGTIAGGNEIAGGRLSVLLDPQQIADGPNVVELYAYDRGTLTPVITKADVPYVLETNADGIVSISAEGRVWDMTNTTGRYVGFASTPEPRQVGRTPPIRGWAGDSETGEAAEAILIIAGSDVLLSQATRTQRQDVVDVSGDERLLDSGWSFNLTPDQFAADPTAVALFPDGTFHVMVPVQREGG